jgi:hypothetical protein
LAAWAHANDHVVAEAHDRRARGRFDCRIAPACRRAGIGDVPFAFGHQCERDVIGEFRRHVFLQRTDVGIGRLLRGGRRRAGIFVAAAWARPR